MVKSEPTLFIGVGFFFIFFHDMKFSVLGSGSKGNSVYIEGSDSAILIDAGFSGKELQARLECIGRSLDHVDGIFLTHEHDDHISGAGVVSRKRKIPLFANLGTFLGAERRIGRPHAFMEFVTGEAVAYNGLVIRSFRVSHDTTDPVGFVISDGRHRLGYCTDTGKVTHLMLQRLQGCEAIIIEFNHNLHMLRNGPYPLPLQQRVRSVTGHLSNEQGAACLAELLNPQVQIAVLAHLSETNNTPEFAYSAAMAAVDNWGDTVLQIVGQHHPLPLCQLHGTVI